MEDGRERKLRLVCKMSKDFFKKINEKDKKNIVKIRQTDVNLVFQSTATKYPR